MASTSLGSQPTPRPRVNFPIPQELRDEIYEWLLSSKVVSNGMRYHFNTEIFSINKTIKQEAEEWLYKHNLFVVVSWKWPHDPPPGLLEMIPRLCTTKERVQRMKNYSLHIHLSSALSKSDKGAHASWPGELPAEIVALNSLTWMLILQEDLDVFAAIFGLILQAEQGKVVVIGCQGGVTNLQTRRPVFIAPMSVQFKLMETEHRPMTPKLQQKLFDNLQDLLVGENAKVKFSSQGCAVAAQLAARLAASIGPQVIWANRRKWSMFVQLRKVKWACDMEVKEGNEERAYHCLNAVTDWAAGLLDTRKGLFPGLPFRDDVDIAIGIRIFDCLVSKAWLEVRLGKEAQFRSTMDLLIKCERNNARVHDGVCYWTWLGSNHLLHLYGVLFNPFTWPEGYTNRQFIDKLSMDSEQKQGEYLTHDLKVIRERADLDKAPSPDILPLELCSIRTMKPCTAGFNSHGTGDPSQNGNVPRNPRTGIGWVNIDHLGKLSVEEKERINEVQKSSGLESTDLDAFARDVNAVRFSWQDWK